VRVAGCRTAPTGWLPLSSTTEDISYLFVNEALAVCRDLSNTDMFRSIGGMLSGYGRAKAGE
jgi:hypothetical protein